MKLPQILRPVEQEMDGERDVGVEQWVTIQKAAGLPLVILGKGNHHRLKIGEGEWDNFGRWIARPQSHL